MGAEELISGAITDIKNEEFDEYPTRWYYLGEDNQVHGWFIRVNVIARFTFQDRLRILR